MAIVTKKCYYSNISKAIYFYFYSRFMPPVTVTPWREIRSATHYGPVCPQLLPETRNETAALLKMSQGRLKAIRDMKHLLSNQTEDCLYLNVYSPRSSAISGKNITQPR